MVFLNHLHSRWSIICYRHKGVQEQFMANFLKLLMLLMNCWFVVSHRGVTCLERVLGRWEDSIDWYHLCLNEKRFTLSDVVLRTNTKKQLQLSKLQTPGGMVFVNAYNTKASAPKRWFLKMFYQLQSRFQRRWSLRALQVVATPAGLHLNFLFLMLLRVEQLWRTIPMRQDRILLLLT